MQAFRLEPDIPSTGNGNGNASNANASEPATPPRLSPASLPQTEHLPEVSMVEAADVTGVTFSPELWIQRRHWALEVLRREGVRSVLDIGCGPGALLETLVQPPSTVCEAPLREKRESEEGEEDEPEREVFISRLAGLDNNPAVLPSALSILSAPHPNRSFPPVAPRWEPLHTELYLGDIEKYNQRLEGYEAIAALEVIEHLDPNVLSRFGVVTMGTYRPRLMLISTPNFDFNSKFPRHDHDHEHDFAHRGFIDPTGRTERVFRHSDHKVEMTSAEFREWATSAAADWGYRVDISGVGISSSPSYYPSDHITPGAPIYASNVAIFRFGSGIPARSPRSVRSTELPWLSKESNHPHKLVGRFEHPATMTTANKPKGAAEVRETVRSVMQGWGTEEVSMGELWGERRVAEAAGGSKRYLVSVLGGYGDQPAVVEDKQSNGNAAGRGREEREFEVVPVQERGLHLMWNRFKRDESGPREEQTWGETPAREPPSEATGGW